jgi:hypothetical protein
VGPATVPGGVGQNVLNRFKISNGSKMLIFLNFDQSKFNLP